MKRIARGLVISFLGALFVGLTFQNCGPSFNGQAGYDDDLSVKPSGMCEAALLSEFSKNYHPFLRKLKCSDCHAPGGIRYDAPISHPDPIIAFGEFRKRGATIINSKIRENHNSAGRYNGSDNNVHLEMDKYMTQWQSVERNCGSSALSIKTSSQVANFFDPAKIDDIEKCGISDPLLSINASQRLTWDLGAARADLAGISISMEVKVFQAALFGVNICGHRGYEAGHILVTTNRDVKIKNLRILLNEKHYDTNTFMIERTIPAGSIDLKLFNSASGGYGVFETGSSIYSDQWSLSIEKIEVM